MCEGFVDYIIEFICGLDMGRKVNGFWVVKIWCVILLCGLLVCILVIKVLCL